MRWIFLGLVIINVFYFIWSQQGFSSDKQQVRVVAKPMSEDVERVQLLDEAPGLNGDLSRWAKGRY